MFKTVRVWAGRLIPLVLLIVAAVVLWRELGRLDPADIGAEMAGWGAWRLAGAAGLTLASYALLAGMEWLGLRWSGAAVPFRTVMLGSFCANAFAHTIGFAMLIGGAVRARLYARSGASLLSVAQTSVFCAVSFGLGIAALAGIALLVEPSPPILGLQLHPRLGQGLGVLLVQAPAAYVVACHFIRQPVTVFGHAVSLPSGRLALGQVAVGFADNVVSAMIVWLLLGGAGGAYAAFAGPYALATVAGVASSVPGGAGVFEGTVLALLPHVPRPALVAAFLGYRLIYYLVPLALAAGMMARAGLGPIRNLQPVRELWRRMAPMAIALAAFGLGATLILTGIGRIAPERLTILRATVPATALETSHLLSLVAGLALMAVSLLLVRRHVTAVPVVMVAAVTGASTALLRGLDIGPSLFSTGLALTVFANRKAFDRKGAWGVDQLLPWWLAGTAAVLAGGVILGLWIYDDTPYEARLWAEVGYHADPARFLRSIAVLGAALLASGAWALARASGPSATPARADALASVRPLVVAEPDTTARLALLGDKALLRSEGGEAFIMYGAEGRSLIAMGDPVGDAEAGRALLWRFKEMAHAADARPVIYQVSPRWLTAYLDLGLSLLKLGEEARVPLPAFSLEGGRRAKLRQAHAKAVREGLSFEVVRPPQTAALLAELRVISDAWLVEHGGREKGFSLGRFDVAILAADPIALVRREGRVVGFANIWTGGEEEASIDLMRHLSDAPQGVMDFLFVELFLWAKAEGFQWFNLGMAPLSGLATHPLAPVWHKIGAQIALRGSRFYGFAGLRAFKAKFDPVWTPRYLAAPPTALAAAMLDATRLISRAPPIPLTNP